MKKTFCLLFFRNFHYYADEMRFLILKMAAASIAIQVSLFYALGNMDQPPAAAVLIFGLDTFIVVVALQIVMTTKTSELFLQENNHLKMKYSPHSYMMATWLSSVMNLKLYSLTVSCCSFWIVALPTPTGMAWF
jgi:hypothetical protein